MTFQTQVNQQPAPGLPGDFASANPRATVLAGQGGLVTGPNGLNSGQFAWLDPTTRQIVSNTGAGAPNGFVHNEHNGMIVNYLGETTTLTPAGMGVGNVFAAGDFWCKNNGTITAVPGNKVYANNATGQAVYFAATGATPPNGGTSTASTIAAGTSTSVTGYITEASTTGGQPYGLLTVSVVGSGGLVVGGILAGTGVQTGTQITGQVSGTPGGVGVYTVSIPQTVNSLASQGTITQTYGLLTVGGTVTGTFSVGDAISAASAGTVITALSTGVGQAGTYIVNNTQTVASTAINAIASTETAWYVDSFAAPGEVFKMTTRSQG